MDGSGKDLVVEKPTGGLRQYYKRERKGAAKAGSVANSAPGRYEVNTSIETRNNTDGGNKQKAMKDLNREAADKQETISASLPRRQSSSSGGHGPDGGQRVSRAPLPCERLIGNNSTQGKVNGRQPRNAVGETEE